MEFKKWQDNWTQIRELGAGGQGSTHEVKSKSDDRRGVLKLLNKANDPKARARMAREAINLLLLEKDNVAVPRLLDHNTADHQNPDVDLFIVMEFIPGDTLDKIVNSKGRLTLEQSVAIAMSLCKTIEAIHNAGVVHRDLKPANLMVRRLEPADVVVLDLGLSYERMTQESVTATNETIKNEMISLPEATLPGGNRRDPRSDITNVVCVFLFCLTGKLPCGLRDSSDRPPHRWPDFLISEILKDDPAARDVELLFDRGFSVDIANRFQSMPELAERLSFLLIPGRERKRNPIDLDRELGIPLRQRSRAIQLKEISDLVTPLWQKVAKHVHGLKGKTQTFFMSIGTFSGKSEMPPGIELVAAWQHSIVVAVKAHPKSKFCPLCFGATGDQCALFYAVTQQPEPRRLRRAPTATAAAAAQVLAWKPVTWFDPKQQLPSDEQMEDWINEVISEAMELLNREI